jgi:hypothetical protein
MSLRILGEEHSKTRVNVLEALMCGNDGISEFVYNTRKAPNLWLIYCVILIPVG